jgi:hypothetical protein
MEEMVGLVSTCGRELLWGWQHPIGLMVSFMIFTASVQKILDTTLYIRPKLFPSTSCPIHHYYHLCYTVQVADSAVI